MFYDLHKHLPAFAFNSAKHPTSLDMVTPIKLAFSKFTFIDLDSFTGVTELSRMLNKSVQTFLYSKMTSPHKPYNQFLARDLCQLICNHEPTCV